MAKIKMPKGRLLHKSFYNWGNIFCFLGNIPFLRTNYALNAFTGEIID